MSLMLNENRLLECGNSCRAQKQENAMTQKQQIENHRELSGKRIVVLGGSSGIGLAVAQQAVAQGATAIIASSNADRVKQAVATLDGKAEGHMLDLSNERDIQNFFQKIGDFDHLVYTAGDTLQLNELAETDLTEARRAFELRYWAALAAVELAPIRVNAVCPGVVRTNLWQSMNADAREHLYESVGKSLLVGRVGEACEIARALSFPHAGGIQHGADRG